MLDIESFRDPSYEFRGKPFWSWNGDLDKSELLRQIHVMKAMGFGGFFMHSRTGLQTEYLSDEWFDLINACADEAQDLGMEAWLYDEDRWPSGTAGGVVTENPKYRMKALRLFSEKSENFIFKDDYLAVFEVTLNKNEIISYKKIKSKEEICDKTTIQYFKVVETKHSSFYNGYTYLDTLNREATDAFIESTYVKYKDKCGNRFGKSIKGIFTDEPNRGDMLMTFQGRLDCANFNIPWTGSISKDFYNKYGYCVLDYLPELFYRKKSEELSKIKWQYIELLQQLFIDNFLKPIDDWCNDNHIQLTGHVLHENTLANQTAVFGSVMRAYEYMGVPGIDFLADTEKPYWIAKQLYSVARQIGKKWMLSELYGCTGWHADMQLHKRVGDWQALLGVNLRCPHLSWYTMEGEAKRDCPGSIFYQSAWYKEYSYIEDYFSRLHVLMGQGEDQTEILVINPIESVWPKVYAGWAHSLASADVHIKQLENYYTNLCETFLGNRIDFDYGDEDIISRHTSIQNNTTPLFTVGKASYKTVIIAGCLTLRGSTVKLLEKFSVAGGQVIFIDDVPTYVDCEKSDALTNLAQNTLHLNLKKTVDRLKEDIEKVISINCKDIFTIHKKIGTDDFFVMMNVARKKCDDVIIDLKISGTKYILDCRTGEICSIGNISQLHRNFDEGEELVIYISEKSVLCNNTIEEKKMRQTNSFDLAGEYSYILSEKNVCVLDIATLFVEDKKIVTNEVLRIDDFLREKYSIERRNLEMIQPWYKEYILKTPEKHFGNIALEFEFFVKEMPSKKIYLSLEQSERYAIKINPHMLQKDILREKWIDDCFDLITIPLESLHEGKNTITLHSQFSEKMNIEAIFLLGDFGVKITRQDKTLVALPKKLKTTDIKEQGFPFYGEAINYQINSHIPYAKNKHYLLDYEGFSGACVKLITPEGKRFGGFKPYVFDVTDFVRDKKSIVLQAIFTRRNTFGPLHQTTIFAAGYSDANFKTTGKDFSEDYRLVPVGFDKFVVKEMEEI